MLFASFGPLFGLLFLGFSDPKWKKIELLKITNLRKEKISTKKENHIFGGKLGIFLNSGPKKEGEG